VNLRTPAWQTAGAPASTPRNSPTDHLAGLGPKLKRVGIDRASYRADAADLFRQALPGVEFAEAYLPLERLRACKAQEELQLLRTASELVVNSIPQVIASHCRV
jgi:Xaa-Pro aminopeptidase